MPYDYTIKLDVRTGNSPGTGWAAAKQNGTALGNCWYQYNDYDYNSTTLRDPNNNGGITEGDGQLHDIFLTLADDVSAAATINSVTSSNNAALLPVPLEGGRSYCLKDYDNLVKGHGTYGVAVNMPDIGVVDCDPYWQNE